jgi:membrane protease subunit HflC
MVSFTVRWQEKALVLTFGKITRQVEKPGLQWIWPWQSVVKFDCRLRTLEQQFNQTQTRDKQNLIVSIYVNWRISDPQVFYERFRVGDTTIAEDIVLHAEKIMRSSWLAPTSNMFAEYNFSELVTLDPAKFKLKALEKGVDGKGASMLARVRQEAQAEGGYGVEIVDLGIRRLGVPDRVTESVFNRMRADREAEVGKLMSEGTSVATIKVGAAKSQADIRLAEAQAEEKRIKGEGDAEAAGYYASFLNNPELANFLRRLETLRKTLSKRTTIVLDSNSPPYELLLTGPEKK